MSFTVTKKIVLARALLKQPKLLILEDALDQFSDSETRSIIDYIGHPKNPWALVIVSGNSYWKTYCKEVIQLKEGTIISKS